jgi:hypothetical protein
MVAAVDVPGHLCRWRQLFLSARQMGGTFTHADFGRAIVSQTGETGSSHPSNSKIGSIFCQIVATRAEDANAGWRGPRLPTRVGGQSSLSNCSG